MMTQITHRERECDACRVTGISALVPLECHTLVEAQISVPVATVQLLHYWFQDPIMGFLRDPDCYLVDMCLTPRASNARARYCEHWAPDRFERLGNVFVVPPGRLVQVGSDAGRTSTVVCRLRSDAVRTWLGIDLEWTGQRLDSTLDIGEPNIRSILLRLAEEARHPGFASRVLIELLAGQLAIELGRYGAALVEGLPASGLASWRLRLIDERLAEFGEPPTLTELAALCRLSVRQLTRGFRVSRGCSIGDYLARYRVGYAKRLLVTEQSVKAIAYSLGFASPSGFCYAFRRLAGESPGQFRQRALRTG